MHSHDSVTLCPSPLEIIIYLFIYFLCWGQLIAISSFPLLGTKVKCCQFLSSRFIKLKLLKGDGKWWDFQVWTSNWRNGPLLRASEFPFSFRRKSGMGWREGDIEYDNIEKWFQFQKWIDNRKKRKKKKVQKIYFKCKEEDTSQSPFGDACFW